jgi:hypothetical protein
LPNTTCLQNLGFSQISEALNLHGIIGMNVCFPRLASKN